MLCYALPSRLGDADHGSGGGVLRGSHQQEDVVGPATDVDGRPERDRI